MTSRLKPPPSELVKLERLFRKGRMRDVIMRTQRLLKKYPESQALRNTIGSALAATGQHKAGVSHFRKALDVQPDYAAGHHNLGLALTSLGKLDTAFEHLKKAHSLQPNHVDFALSLNAALRQRGDWEEGLAILTALADKLPQRVDWQLSLGRTLLGLRKREAALKAYQAGLALAPDNAQFHLKIGGTLILLERTNEALVHFRKAFGLEPENWELFSEVGHFWALRSHYDKAEKAYERAIELNPREAYLYSELAFANSHLGKTDTAISNFRKCIELDPNDAQAQHLLAAISTDVTPETAPAAYVEGLFNGYASGFDESLVGDLKYSAPEILQKVLGGHKPPEQKLEASLDLGCGTGLLALALSSHIAQIDGVDLAGDMIEIARERNVYRQLDKMDVVDAITQRPAQYDIYMAADVLIYIGDLSHLFQALSEFAKPGALFLFSTEHDDSPTIGYALRETGRYSHAYSYVEALCERHGATIVSFHTDNLRFDAGEMLVGGMYLLRFGA